MIETIYWVYYDHNNFVKENKLWQDDNSKTFLLFKSLVLYNLYQNPGWNWINNSIFG